MDKKKKVEKNNLALIGTVALVILFGLVSVYIFKDILPPNSIVGLASYSYTCVDDDASDNPAMFGTVKIYDSRAHLKYTYTDKCSTSTEVQQYSCLRSSGSLWGIWGSKKTTCAYGCTNGVCNSAPCVDNDHDGYGTNCALGPDCNDNNAQINPGAPEVCDGIDNNCNLFVDEGVMNVCTDYSSCQSYETCSSCPSVPAEICNYLDDNCNSQIDEGVRNACNQCGPVPQEVCTDGIDNDCDGSTDCLDSDCSSDIACGNPSPGAKTVRRYFQGDYDSTSLDGKSQFVAGQFEIINTGMGDSKLAPLKTYNPNIKILRYTKIGGVRGTVASGCCKTSGSNCVPVDITNAEYNLWVDSTTTNNLLWYDSLGNKITNPQPTYNGWCYIDIISPTKRALWITAYKKYITSLLADPYVDGVFLDNSAIPIPGYSSYDFESNPTVRQQYYDALKDIITQVHGAFPTKYILINAYNNRLEVSDNQRGLELVDAGASAIMREAMAYKAGATQYYERTRLEKNIRDFTNIQKGVGLTNGPKETVVYDYFNNIGDTQFRLYSLAVYLLYANGKSLHYNGWYGLSSSPPDFPEETLDLGNPLADYSIDPSGLLKRDYEKGTILVNTYRSDETSTPISFTVGTNKEKLAINGGGAWIPGGSGGTLTWTAIPSIISLAPNEAVIYHTSTTAPAQPQVTATVSGNDWSLPTSATVSSFSGQFPMDNDAGATSQMKQRGYTLTWNQLNPSDGTYNWVPITSLIQSAHAGGYGVVIRLKTNVILEKASWGNTIGIPSWVMTKYPSMKTAYLSGSSSSASSIKVAVPWDSNLQAEYTKFVQAFAAQSFLSDPSFLGVYATGISPSYGEEMWLDDTSTTNLLAAGMTSDCTNLRDAFVSRMKTWKNAVPDPASRKKIAWVGATYLGGTCSPSIAHDMNVEALNDGFGIRGGNIEVSLDYIDRPAGFTDIGQSKTLDPYFGSDPLCATLYKPVQSGATCKEYYLKTDWNWVILKEGRFFGDEIEAFGSNANADEYRTSILRSLEMGQRFLWTSPTSTSLDTSITDYYNLEAGKDASTAQDAFVILREGTRIVDWPTCAAIKNLERWMYQRDTATARSTPTKFVKRAAPGNKDCYVTSAVDSSQGAGFFNARKVDATTKEMVFSIDPAFMSSTTTNDVSLKVSYYDNGEQWTLTYCAPTGTATTPLIVGTGGDVLKTVTFSLPNFKPTKCLSPDSQYGGFDVKVSSNSNTLALSTLRVIRSDR